MPRYTQEFKQSVINDYLNGMSREKVAEKYNIAQSSVTLWTRQYKTDHQPSVSRDEYLEAEELKRLRIDSQIFMECRCTRQAPMSDRISEVLRLKDKYSIHALCRVLDVNRSAVYHRDRRAPLKTQIEIEDENLMPLIADIFEKGRGVFGARRIKVKLNEMGYVASEKRICRLMKQLDLKVDYSTKYNFTPYRKNPYYVNRLDRQFRPDAPNTVWVSDITMIRIGQGLLFLCPVMDLYARKIISYTVSEYMYSNIVIDALTKAYIARGCPQNLLFHSDQGTQFTAYHVKLMMRKQKVTLSYSNCGCPYDNAVGESFFATMKKEFIHRTEFENKEDFYAELQEYINFYNDHRPHSTIGYLTPSKAEDDYFSTHKTA